MTTPEMSQSKFWQLIDSARTDSNGDLDAEVQSLKEHLTQLSPEEIIQFQKVMEQFVALSDRWDLRAAVHIITGSSGEKAFSSFRGWLIAQGRHVFKDVLDDPEALADVVESEVSCPGILRAASEAYKAKAGSPMPEPTPLEVEPAGEEWAEADLPELFPRLWEQFSDDEDEND